MVFWGRRPEEEKSEPLIRMQNARDIGAGVVAEGILDIEDAKEIVANRLIARTGLSPLEFDEWLGY